MRRDEGGTSLHLKATARSTRSDRDGGTDTYGVTKINLVISTITTTKSRRQRPISQQEELRHHHAGNGEMLL
ncbi:hypothetical protein AOLI_G00054080 [Acnodon oligacanthus]